MPAIGCSNAVVSCEKRPSPPRIPARSRYHCVKLQASKARYHFIKLPFIYLGRIAYGRKVHGSSNGRSAVDLQSNVSRTAIESQSSRSCNRRLSVAYNSRLTAICYKFAMSEQTLTASVATCSVLLALSDP